ncbi:MAG: hypothetical protein ACI898_000867 [Flavobacteriales bacterium]|jgi:hypothetical protein
MAFVGLLVGPNQLKITNQQTRKKEFFATFSPQKKAAVTAVYMCHTGGSCWQAMTGLE